ncbi:MAG TPA: gamma carbonic anhydrase family protein [Methanomassiliicoccales archaeon]|nr:gamma carbonic anhydrase family protein [Methanomassiliicoccales archaeon]
MPIYIDPTAIIIGDVKLADGVSVWPYAVLRGDEGRIVVGEGSNIQDHVMLHVGPGFPTIIGKDCTVGHGAVINGAEIGDRCIIGMNCSIVEGAVIGDECVVGAGSVITGKTVIPPRSLVVGVPGKVVKTGDASFGERALENARAYQKLRDEHLAGKYTRRMGR